MKKAAFICIVAIFTLYLVGCSKDDTSMDIDKYKWQAATVQNAKDGSITACSSDYILQYEDAEEISVELEANKGNMTINDLSDNQKYSGTCDLIKTTPSGEIYEINVGDEDGMATCSVTNENGKETPTLIITLGEYSINFQPDTE